VLCRLSRLVKLIGIGGTGGTRLARRVRGAAARPLHQRRLVLDLAPLDRRKQIAPGHEGFRIL
jgi:predicted ATPase